MITKYPADSRGAVQAGWLTSHFSFSFGQYYDPMRMGFGALRVLNDDIIAPSAGFGMHPHNNMEIITIVTGGTLEHKDSEGNGGILKSNDVQVMSAGSGIAHSEWNASSEEPLALFQLWIETKERDITPAYSQKTFAFVPGSVCTVASGLGDDGALYIHQAARVQVATLAEKGTQKITVTEGNGLFVLVIEGEISLEGETLARRDAVEITESNEVLFASETGGQLLIIEVPV